MIIFQELLNFLNDVALDVFTSGGAGVFPYKSFSEVVHLVMISMLREVLRNSGKVNKAHYIIRPGQCTWIFKHR